MNEKQSSIHRPPPDGWRTFLLVWGTQAVSVLGSALTYFTITVWLTTTLYPGLEQKTQLAWALATLSLSFAIPTIFVGPIAGAWADRHDRKRTMIGMNFGSGCLSLLIVSLILSHRMNLEWLAAVGALNATLAVFHNAAFDSSYAMLVPEEKLPRANGMMQTIQSLSGVVAPGVAATLIALPALVRQGALMPFVGILGRVSDGAVLTIGLDAATFFLAGIIPIFLYIPSPRRSDLRVAGRRNKSIWEDIFEGASYIWYRRSFLWLLGTFTVANFVGGSVVLSPLIVRYQLAPDWTRLGFSFESTLALTNTLASVGGLAGGFLISTWGGLKRHRVYAVLVPLIFAGLARAVVGASPWVFLSSGAWFVAGAMIPIMNAHSQAIWQSQTPRELQGRVFSVRRLIAQFSYPASTFIMGGLASRLEPGVIFLILGVLLVSWCVLNLFNPHMMRIEDKEWIEAEAHRLLRAST